MEEQAERLLKLLADAVEKGLDKLPGAAHLALESVATYYTASFSVSFIWLAAAAAMVGLCLYFGASFKRQIELGNDGPIFTFGAAMIVSAAFSIVMIIIAATSFTSTFPRMAAPLGYLINRAL